MDLRTPSPLRHSSSHWRHHPAVRSGDDLTLGERAADRMRNGMGSWPFVFAALAFLAIWTLGNRNRGFDPYPFILLNLLLSCLAAMQGAILLIAAKRSDHIASELAQHDYATDSHAADRIEQLHERIDALSDANRQLLDNQRAVLAMLSDSPPRSLPSASTVVRRGQDDPFAGS